jgi:hypothetical protein
MPGLVLHSSFSSLVVEDTLQKIQLDKLEKDNGILLPESYKSFLQSYCTGKDSLRKDHYYDENEELRLPAIGYYFISDNICISIEDFISIDEAVGFWKSDAEQFQYNKEGLMRIVYTNDPGGGGIYIGMKENNFGSIYKAMWDSVGENSICKIANDIDEFIKGIKSFPLV